MFLTGAASHLDTFDPKPDAPAEIRGEFGTIRHDRSPALRVGEHLPRLAARADKYAVVRTLAHRDNNHLVATHHLPHRANAARRALRQVASRDDWPELRRRPAPTSARAATACPAA